MVGREPEGGNTYVHPYASAINHGFMVFFGQAMEAMRDPRARPSNVSIKRNLIVSHCNSTTQTRLTHGGRQWQ